ncbi:contractile injection system protein, VgrG/Pvc8 family, partial [Lachnospiraceae bacterium 38-14]
MERWQKSEEEQEVTVKHKGEAVFCGLVEHASFEPVTKDVYRVRIHLISGSTALDREKVSMSFQDTKLTYVDIAEKAVSSTPGASILCTAGKGEKPRRPMIQYGETDWEFAARLASRVKAVL